MENAKFNYLINTSTTNNKDLNSSVQILHVYRE
jgi:hypothetical protein